jgi:hypothetical protein
MQQLNLERHFSKEDLIALCHSRNPERRHIEGFLGFNLIAPLPIWSPVPEKHRKTAQDSFSIWGLEAQHPKYLPSELQPFVYFLRNKRGKIVGIGLREGAYKKVGVSDGAGDC